MSGPVLGLVVNPVAGMGGRVGLHGTDGRLDRALERGAVPVAPARADRALARLQQLAPHLRVVAGGGVLGADHLRDRGWDVTELPTRPGRARSGTDAEDTRETVRAMVRSGVGLVLFVGGDGTARDVAAVVGDVPVLGVPAGVKMHSGVFGTTPEAAAAAAARFLAGDETATRPAEVVDRDEAGDVRLHGTVQVPAVRSAVQARKGTAGTATDDAAALARRVAAEMEPGRLYLLGPGTTVAEVGAALGVPTTALGVDAVLDGRSVAVDASEADLLALLAEHPRAGLVLGVVGGQGFLLGRGNQQLSPAVLAAVGTDRIEVLATPAKVDALAQPVLHVDIDDPGLASRLVGYRRVRTGPSRSTVLRVVA
ncbi:NAD(+)/NADH kinase [Nocardioides sp. NPDC092400]|uniref:ATP-NAD kinase family protein n=1 Tax=Nocardioides sp. NPDC092400 TaxID=3155196 RepID=UPI0034474AF2